MDLIFLHGAPAVGKLTVARALAPLIPGRLIDNHATIDLARHVFDFSAPGFWDLIARLRLQVIEAAAASDLPYLITTGCYVHPDDEPLLADWESAVTAHGGRLRPVHLRCAEHILFERIGQADRVARQKMTSQDNLADHLSRNDYSAVPRDDVLVLDTDTQPPEATARKIVDHLNLSRV